MKCWDLEKTALTVCLGTVIVLIVAFALFLILWALGLWCPPTCEAASPSIYNANRLDIETDIQPTYSQGSPVPIMRDGQPIGATYNGGLYTNGVWRGFKVWCAGCFPSLDGLSLDDQGVTFGIAPPDTIPEPEWPFDVSESSGSAIVGRLAELIWLESSNAPDDSTRWVEFVMHSYPESGAPAIWAFAQGRFVYSEAGVDTIVTHHGSFYWQPPDGEPWPPAGTALAPVINMGEIR